MGKFKNNAFGRYRAASGDEAEMQPGSHDRVLKNLQRIIRKTEIDRMEYQSLVRAEERYYNLISMDTRLTVQLICEMHSAWLGKIYSWAGQYRTVDVSKGTFTWPPAIKIPGLMDDFENSFLSKLTPCRGTIDAVAFQMAQVHAELLLIHPFRDGNGRLARWLANIMAAQAGLMIPIYKFSGRGQKRRKAEYIAAVQQGYFQNYDPLAAFFRSALAKSNVSSR